MPASMTWTWFCASGTKAVVSMSETSTLMPCSLNQPFWSAIMSGVDVKARTTATRTVCCCACAAETHGERGCRGDA